MEVLRETAHASQDDSEVESPDWSVQPPPGPLVDGVDLQRYPVGSGDILPDIFTPQQAGIGDDRDPEVRCADSADRLAELGVQRRFPVRDERRIVHCLARLAAFAYAVSHRDRDCGGLAESLTPGAGVVRRAELAVDARVRAGLRADVVDPQAPAQTPRADGAERDR